MTGTLASGLFLPVHKHCWTCLAPMQGSAAKHQTAKGITTLCNQQNLSQQKKQKKQLPECCIHDLGCGPRYISVYFGVLLHSQVQHQTADVISHTFSSCRDQMLRHNLPRCDSHLRIRTWLPFRHDWNNVDGQKVELMRGSRLPWTKPSWVSKLA